MTTPTAKAAGFSGSIECSLKGQSSPEDVLGAVDVGVDPGWYPAPGMQDTTPGSVLRYFDGSLWTQHVSSLSSNPETPTEPIVIPETLRLIWR